MSCGCGGGCTEKIEQLRDMVKHLEGRIFSLEARMLSVHPLRDPYTNVPTWAPRANVGCQVCGAGADGKPMGLVCTNPNCPTRVTSISTTG